MHRCVDNIKYVAFFQALYLFSSSILIQWYGFLVAQESKFTEKVSMPSRLHIFIIILAYFASSTLENTRGGKEQQCAQCRFQRNSLVVVHSLFSRSFRFFFVPAFRFAVFSSCVNSFSNVHSLMNRICANELQFTTQKKAHTVSPIDHLSNFKNARGFIVLNVFQCNQPN